MTCDSCGDNAVQGVIHPVREDDATGQMIGDVLGITKQGAAKRFATAHRQTWVSGKRRHVSGRSANAVSSDAIAAMMAR